MQVQNIAQSRDIEFWRKPLLIVLGFVQTSLELGKGRV